MSIAVPAASAKRPWAMCRLAHGHEGIAVPAIAFQKPRGAELGVVRNRVGPAHLELDPDPARRSGLLEHDVSTRLEPKPRCSIDTDQRCLTMAGPTARAVLSERVLQIAGK
ncbi:MAG: hypothetical protein E6H79_17765 [Betaproteobacteria bacterium]|nr:MAG: hypothetical protein E6H79_17765 [Betaproteobacteria bacterium]